MLIGARHYGACNWIGLWTLYRKEVLRFLTVATQTILAPLVTSLLFLAVFVLALGHAIDRVEGIPYILFLAPGLVMMAMTQNAFANTSSSLLISKVQGNIVDLLMPPLSPLEMTAAIAAAGLTRGLFVGATTLLAMLPFAPIALPHPAFALYHAAMASLMLALLGIFAGLWSEKFDHLAAFTNFIVTPLAFLSGAFYSITRLPEPWASLAQANPFFYMIDGFRYGFVDHADGSLTTGLILMAIVNLLLILLVYRAFATGWRLKA